MTLNDIARMAGVSKSTVSKVLNRPGCLSPDTVSNVHRAMREARFQPRPNRKRRLKLDFTSTKLENVALLFPDPDANAMKTVLSGRLAHGINDVLFKNNINFLLTHYKSDDKLPSCIEKGTIDGIIIRAGQIDDEIFRTISHIPCVAAFTAEIPQGSSIDSVEPDNEMIGQVAAQHLLDKGCTELIYMDIIFDFGHHVEFEKRNSAFKRTAQAKGVRIRKVDFDINSGDFGTLLKQIKSPASAKTGIFVPGDDPMLEHLCWDLKNELKTGRVSITGCYNNDDRQRILGAGATVIDIQPEKIGQAAAEQLIFRVENPEAEYRKILVKPYLYNKI